MKFIHASDLHIDSPLLGLEAYEGAPVERLREATREAIQLARFASNRSACGFYKSLPAIFLTDGGRT